MKCIKFQLFLLSFVLTACQLQTTETIPDQPIPFASVEAPIIWPDTLQKRTVEAASSIHILVYRSGRLAHLGHNHVVSINNINGIVFIDPLLTKTKIKLSLPVSNFLMDDDDIRVKYGSDFSAQLTPEQKTGTLNNMLGPKILDAQNFPTIEIESTRITGRLPTLLVDFATTLKGHTKIISIPVNLSMDDDFLYAQGQLNINQSDFGIEPFSIFGGAIAIKDQLTINFNLLTKKP